MKKIFKVVWIYYDEYLGGKEISVWSTLLCWRIIREFISISINIWGKLEE